MAPWRICAGPGQIQNRNGLFVLTLPPPTLASPSTPPSPTPPHLPFSGPSKPLCCAKYVTQCKSIAWDNKDLHRHSCRKLETVQLKAQRIPCHTTEADAVVNKKLVLTVLMVASNIAALPCLAFCCAQISVAPFFEIPRVTSMNHRFMC